ncbi:MAG: hypothetical protein KAJ17_07735, partial [Candidatus Krumholzibacteria bacterium]|nr:hypothetical protein [Candidatus Krumholzibacteria bacterium]
AVRSADLVLYVVDASQPPNDALIEAVGKLDRVDALLVANKIDLPESQTVATLEELRPEIRCIRVSAETGEGVEELRHEMIQAVAGDELSRIARERVVLNSRLVSLLDSAREKIDALAASLKADNRLEIMAVEAREVLGLYEEATGRRYHADLLDTIFSRFCIGK